MGGDVNRAEARATVGVAAERYRPARGRWPDSPDRLVPEYLGAMPIDPYLGTPLRQLHNPGEFAIYSVGPDGQDGADDNIGNWKKDKSGSSQ